MNDTQEVSLTIVGSDVMEKHPELHHYTDLAGLKGIVGSNTLRATHYLDLNDSSEVVHLRERLVPELTGRFRDILLRRRVSSRINRAISESGGLNKCSRDLAADLIRSFYQSAFADDDSSELTVTAGQPFIASLCTHTTEAYERENGLLSQWRGYSAREAHGGFCLVFDTVELAQMLGSEFEASAYTHLNLHEARYAFADVAIAELFPDLVNTCDAFINSALNGDPTLDDGIQQFFSAATLLKHQAFHEEREVRIVAMPMTGRMEAAVRKERPDVTLESAKPILAIGEGAKTRRFIELFRDSGRELPIRRLIVGPSANQAEQLAEAETISAGRFPVAASNTPFKG